METTLEKERQQQPSWQDNTLRVSVITQNMPDDTFAEGKAMNPDATDEESLRRELEQDVTKINPSVESMESRG